MNTPDVTARSLSMVVLTCTALSTLFACADFEPNDESGFDSEAALLSWEEFSDIATSEHQGETIYRVNWDEAVTLDELERRYADYLAVAQGDAPRATVNLNGGTIDVWSSAQAHNLSYCVSNSFGANKARAVAEFAVAAADWESSADVNFVYVPSEDANCVASNPNVLFAVEPWTAGGACAFFPSGGGCVPRTVVMDYYDFDTNPVWDNIAPNLTTAGVFRHELGHVLGLRHEHTRPESGTCFEDWSWAATTPYDVSSVMHYQWCNGLTQSDMSISDADRRSIELLYSAPGPQAMPQPGARVHLRHGSTGKCAYTQGGDGYTVHNWECWADPTMVFVLDDAGSGHYRLRHEATDQCIYTNAGGDVRHWSCWADPAMSFELVPYLGGYRLRNIQDNLTLVGHQDDGGRVYSNTDANNVPEQVYFVDVLGPATGYWTNWLDRDDPDGTGDWETLSSFSPGQVCANPSSIICETTSGNSYWWTGETVSCSPGGGLGCQNSNQGDGVCEDYRVKFYCP